MPFPTPKIGEDKNKFISRCISFAVDEGMPQKQAVAACHTQFRRKNQMKKDLIFEYFVPIESSADLDGDFTINGIAINETTTSNGHKFLGEELSKSANTLIGVPLLKDHNNSVDSIVGKVKAAHFDEGSRNIPFRAIVKDPKIKELIKDGLLNTVSVGAHVNPTDIEETENGDIIPHNITFKELSVVAIPADGGATFSVALNNAYKSHSNENSDSDERGNETMTEEKTEDKSTTPEEKEEVKEEPAVTEEKVKSWVTEAILTMKESDVDEEKSEPAEEPKEEEKEKEEEEESEEEVEEVEEKGDYKFNQSHNSFSMERKSYNYN